MATFPELMWNYRMSELVAAIAIVQLRRAPTYVEQGIAAGRIYNDAVADIPWIRPQHTPADRDNVYHLWAATFEGDKQGISRDDFARHLRCTLRLMLFPASRVVGLRRFTSPAYE